MSATQAEPSPRRDVLWKQADTVRGYERTRPAIPFEQEEFDIVRRVLDAHCVVPERLLDIGAGDGLATAELMRRMAVGQAWVLDFSEPMLEAARARFAYENVKVVEGDLYDPGWSTNLPIGVVFDVIISRHAIHHLPDERKRALYGEVFGLLRRGGMFVNIEHVESASPFYQAAFDQLMVESIHDHAPEGTPLDEVVTAYRTRMDGELNILAPVEDQCAWLRDIGFEDVDCPFKALELAVITARRPHTT
jgi:SAM-dependent methyltransferase